MQSLGYSTVTSLDDLKTGAVLSAIITLLYVDLLTFFLTATRDGGVLAKQEEDASWDSLTHRVSALVSRTFEGAAAHQVTQGLFDLLTCLGCRHSHRTSRTVGCLLGIWKSSCKVP